MKILSFIILFLTIIPSIYSQEKINEAGIGFNLPNNNWKLEEKHDYGNVILYNYAREAIVNKNGQNIIPYISFVIETIPDSTDLVKYSLDKRINKPFEVKEVFTYETEGQKLKFLNAIGYKGIYKDKDIEHTIYVIHLINKNKGVQIICDITSELFDKYDKEFIALLKSIKEL